MANTTIDQLLSLTGATIADGDLLLVYDASANIEKQISVTEMRAAIGIADLPIADKIVHAGDTNTAIRFPANDTVTVETGGAERFRITSTGTVGIGETSPSTYATGPAIVIKNSGSFGPVIMPWNTTNDTSFTQISARKDRAGAVVQSGDSILSVRANGYDGAAYEHLGDITFAVDGAVSSGIVPGRISFNTANSSGTSVERLRIDSSGNLGIGTTAPTHILDVNGNTIRIRTAQTPASAGSSGTQGQIAWDSSYVYVCVATNTWKRAALATW